ncbi:Histone-fold [Penicillium occitanis (nom. inval.)]|nr:hypothetical protein PENOC_032790 [Penicillium occitanis (nom. inval.)]PCH05525.1 Histone-fold [Penicillium occitanis (nom. inval.)]
MPLGQSRGLGLHGSRRRRLTRDTIQGITKPAIRFVMPYSSPSSSHYQAHYRVSRLARRGGIKRMSAAIYPEMRLVLKQRLETIIKNLVLVLESSATPSHERKTVTTTDNCD